MAILDAQNMFSDSQVVAATGVSTNSIDLGSDRNIGIGEPMAVLIMVEAIDATSGDETYTVALEADDNSAFSSPATVLSMAIPRAGGARQVALPVPPNTDTERFLQLRYTLGGTTPSITVSAYLVPLHHIPSGAVYYPAGYTIS